MVECHIVTTHDDPLKNVRTNQIKKVMYNILQKSVNMLFQSHIFPIDNEVPMKTKSKKYPIQKN